MRMQIRLRLMTTILVAASSVSGAIVRGQDSDLASTYGFLPVEIFKLNDRSSNVVAGDLDGDGHRDLLVVDNSKSRLDLLIQKVPFRPMDMADVPQDAEVNEVFSDQRFDLRKVSVDKQVASVTLGDFNHDRRLDIAYFGVPDLLVLRIQSERGDWSDRVTFRIPDVPAASWNTISGDLNADGRDDIVVLGKSVTYLFYQSSEGSISDPVKLFNTSEKLSIVQIQDVDGDGRNDLCYRSDGEKDPSFCVRFQSNDGKLGPEYAFEMPATRGIVLYDLDGKPGTELLSIDGRTGRVKASRLEQPQSAPDAVATRLLQFGFGAEGRARGRDVATGDVNGDGLTDVVISDPTAARVIVFRQRAGQGLDLGTSYPSLNGVTDVRIIPGSDKRPAQILALSSKENTLGVSTFVDGRLSFPQAISIPTPPIDGLEEFNLAVIELADLNGDKQLEIVCGGLPKAGRSKSGALLTALQRSGDQWEPFQFGKQPFLEVDQGNSPTRIEAVDANADGRIDLMVFFGDDRVPTLLSPDAEGNYATVEAGSGIQLGEFGAKAFFAGRDRRNLMVAQGRFARQVGLDEQGQWQVVDQYNADESNARIEGVIALDLDGQPGDEIVLVDTGIARLRVYRKQDGLFAPWKEVELGEFDYEAARVADLNNDQREDLLLLGRGSFGVVFAGQTSPALKEIASYQSPTRNAFLADLAGGDLNQDGAQDIAVIDTRSHTIELLNYDPVAGLRKVQRFQVFEEKSFSNAGQGGAEPREIVLSDVTSDGRTDLILLAHDRLLLYPQDPGPQTGENSTTQVAPGTAVDPVAVSANPDR